MENRHSVSMHFMQAVQCSGMGWDDCASGEMVFKNWCGFLVAQDTCGAIPWYIYFYKSGFQSSLYRMVSFRSQWKGLEFGCAGAQIMISQEFVSSTCTALGLCHKGWQDGTRGGVAVEICTWKLLSWEMHHWAQSCCSVEAVSAQAEQCQWLCLGCACSHTHPGPGVPRELSSFLRWALNPAGMVISSTCKSPFYSLSVALSPWVFHPLEEQVGWLQGLAVIWDLVRNFEGKQFLLQSTKPGHSWVTAIAGYRRISAKNVEFCEGSVDGEQLHSAKKPVTKYGFFLNGRNMLNELLLCSQEIWEAGNSHFRRTFMNVGYAIKSNSD